MVAALILNPVSGGAQQNELKLPQITARLESAGINVEVWKTATDLGAADCARTALAAGHCCIIVGGGDGTVGEVAKVLVGRAESLGVLPVGTFNNFARSIAVPFDLDAACDVIAHGEIHAIDVGEAVGRGYFLEAAGAGLDAELFPIGEEIKGGRWTRICDALRRTWKFQPQEFTFTFDEPLSAIIPDHDRRHEKLRNVSGNLLRRRALLAIVANGPYYGGAFNVAPGARLRDGRLALNLYRHYSKLALAWHFGAISRGSYRFSPKIESFSVREVTIDAGTSLPVHLDGQPSGTTPVTLRVLPQALRVHRPPIPKA